MIGARRIASTMLLLAGAFVAVALLAAPPASAHPLGNFTINRYGGLVLSPGRVSIQYVIDMAEIPTFQAMSQIDSSGDGTASAQERQAWADRMAPQLRSGLYLTVDGRAVTLQVIGDAMAFRPGQGGLPITRLTVTFEGPMPLSGEVAFVDHNYDDRIGWKEITARSATRVAISGSSVPAESVSDELLRYPVDLLASPLDVRQASLSFRPGVSTNETRAGSLGPSVSGAPIASGGSFAALITWQLSPLILLGSLGLAFVFGAVHALGPGHGKTIAAAYLVGSGARVRQAASVGAAVSLMHTASVLAIGLIAAAVSASFPSEMIYPWLEVVAGAVALSLGVALFVIRVRARRRPEDSHAHGLGHAHPHAPVSNRGLMALAVSGGMLPSPTALVVLLAAIATHRLGYGLALIAAFSAGLAAALMLIAMIALRARTLVSRTLGTRTAAALPVLSALVIVGFGLFFVVGGALRV